MKSCEVFAPAWGAPEEVPTENINLKQLDMLALTITQLPILLDELLCSL